MPRSSLAPAARLLKGAINRTASIPLYAPRRLVVTDSVSSWPLVREAREEAKADAIACGFRWPLGNRFPLERPPVLGVG